MKTVERKRLKRIRAQLLRVAARACKLRPGRVRESLIIKAAEGIRRADRELSK